MDFCKKVLLTILVVCSLCTISGCGKKETDYDNFIEIIEKAEENQYEQIVSHFQELSISDVANTVSASENENVYFYFGRLSCLYCRELVIKKQGIVNRQK